MPITNDIEMATMLSNIASKVIEKVSKDMLFILKEYINDETYDPLPNAYYYNGSGKPTFQFREAFEFTQIENKIKQVVTELFYNWQEMSYDPDTFLHGSPWNGDMRQQLADILNVDGSTGFSTKIRKPYWDDYIKEMFDQNGLTKLFDVYMRQEFGKQGIIITNG